MSKFSKITRVIYPQNRPKQTCDYWLLHQTNKNFAVILITDIGQSQISERGQLQNIEQLQNSTINGAMSFQSIV